MSDNLNTIKNKKVSVNVGGKDRQLYFDLNAFAELEEAFGDLNSMLAALQGGSIKAVRKFLYVGFMHENDKLTEKEVGGWFDMSNIGEITSKITEAMTMSLPQVEEEEKPVEDPNAQSPVNPE
jgi:hypothetical protein